MPDIFDELAAAPKRDIFDEVTPDVPLLAALADFPRDRSRLPDRRVMQGVAGADVRQLPADQFADIPGDLKQAGARTVQGVAGGVAGIPEAIAITADKIGKTFPSIDEGKPLEELATYKLGRAIREKAQAIAPVDETRPKGFFTDTLPQGAGSMAAFIGGGMAGRAARVPAWAATAMLGAGVSGADAFDEAIRAGANEQQAWTSFLVNAGVGTSEAVPIARWLGDLNRAGGGIVRRAMVEGGEEAMQEFVQQVAGNLNASSLAGYDPSRPWYQGSGEGCGGGLHAGQFDECAIPGAGAWRSDGADVGRASAAGCAN